MKEIYARKAAIRHAELKYLAEMLPQLRRMAVDLDESVLTKLLEMAALEAELKFTLEAEYAGVEELPPEKRPDAHFQLTASR